jgi:peptide/nickel transport system substrate-binding protein
MINKRRIGAALAVGSLLFLSACSGSSTSPGGSSGSAAPGSAAPAKGGNLTFDFFTAPLDLDPSTSQDNDTSMQMWLAWFQSLIELNPAGPGYLPVLADKWTVSPNGLTYTFHIRSGVKFSNGKPLTSADVLYSLTRSEKPAISLLNFLVAKTASMSAPNPSTFIIKLKSAWPSLLADLASPNGAIYPQGAFTAANAKTFFNSKPIGTGPFVLTSSTPNTSYVVTRNKYYWNKADYPHLSSITFQIVTDDTARATAVLGGTADVADSPAANQVASFKSNPAVRVATTPYSIVELLALNTAKAPMNNIDVRQAISLAINRAAIVQSGLFGFGTPAKTFIVGPPKNTFQNTSLNLYPFNIAKAKQLMAASGVKTPLTIPFEVSTGTAQTAILNIAQADLAEIGIHLQVIQKDSASVDNDIIGMHYTAATTFWGDVSADPTQQVLFADDPGYCCNAYFTGLHDQTLINMSLQASLTQNRAAAQVLYNKIQVLTAKDAAIIPLYNPQLIHVMSAKVTGFNVDAYGFYDWAKFGLQS